eukprot:14381505-Alexandrium_andersonii.AAC.1
MRAAPVHSVLDSLPQVTVAHEPPGTPEALITQNAIGSANCVRIVHSNLEGAGGEQGEKERNDFRPRRRGHGAERVRPELNAALHFAPMHE